MSLVIFPFVSSAPHCSVSVVTSSSRRHSAKHTLKQAGGGKVTLRAVFLLFSSLSLWWLSLLLRDKFPTKTDENGDDIDEGGEEETEEEGEEEEGMAFIANATWGNDEDETGEAQGYEDKRGVV